MRIILVLSAILAAAVPSPKAATWDVVFFTIASGELDGGYTTAARAICSRVTTASAGSLRCSPEPTRGSLYNLEALRRGEVEFALVQSDWLHHAAEGTSVFTARGAMDGLRGVASIYVEPIVILTRPGTAIRSLDDLAGKRVDIGHPSSGRNATFTAVMELVGASQRGFAAVLSLRDSSIVPSLCSGAIDAAVIVAGLPSRLVQQAVATCDAQLVGLTGPVFDALVKEAPYYVATVVPGLTYPSIREPVETIGVVATVATLASVDDDLVAAVTEALLADAMARAELGLTLELHPAAAAVLEAAGAS